MDNHSGHLTEAPLTAESRSGLSLGAVLRTIAGPRQQTDAERLSPTPVSIPQIHDAIRSVGGIVHGDGNIFFTNAAKFMAAADECTRASLMESLLAVVEAAEKGLAALQASMGRMDQLSYEKAMHGRLDNNPIDAINALRAALADGLRPDSPLPEAQQPNNPESA